jgi:hypothetical protein
MTLLTLSGFLFATTYEALVGAIIFFPLFIYFALAIWPKKEHSYRPEVENSTNSKLIKAKPVKLTREEVPTRSKAKIDADRRTFIKLIGSAGVTLFFFSLFTRNAEAAFFGSVPGPGTVNLKDIAGNKIDPAEKQATDGYRINQIDDSTPAFYGFQNASGAWYIMREDASGNYRYTKGASDFSTNWTNRASLTYDYFDNIF